MFSFKPKAPEESGTEDVARLLAEENMLVPDEVTKHVLGKEGVAFDRIMLRGVTKMFERTLYTWANELEQIASNKTEDQCVLEYNDVLQLVETFNLPKSESPSYFRGSRLRDRNPTEGDILDCSETSEAEDVLEEEEEGEVVRLLDFLSGNNTTDPELLEEEEEEEEDFGEYDEDEDCEIDEEYEEVEDMLLEMDETNEIVEEEELEFEELVEMDALENVEEATLVENQEFEMYDLEDVEMTMEGEEGEVEEETPIEDLTLSPNSMESSISIRNEDESNEITSLFIENTLAATLRFVRDSLKDPFKQDNDQIAVEPAREDDDDLMVEIAEEDEELLSEDAWEDNETAAEAAWDDIIAAEDEAEAEPDAEISPQLVLEDDDEIPGEVTRQNDDIETISDAAREIDEIATEAVRQENDDDILNQLDFEEIPFSDGQEEFDRFMATWNPQDVLNTYIREAERSKNDLIAADGDDSEIENLKLPEEIKNAQVADQIRIAQLVEQRKKKRLAEAITDVLLAEQLENAMLADEIEHIMLATQIERRRLAEKIFRIKQRRLAQEIENRRLAEEIGNAQIAEAMSAVSLHDLAIEDILTMEEEANNL